MGSSTRFAWCGLGDEVVFLSSSDAVRFPNAILASGGGANLEPGEEILIGSGAVLGRGIDWRIVRWWDPTVTAVEIERHQLMARVSAVTRHVAAPVLGLEGALAAGDRAAILDSAYAMLGNGGGLTPEGDDRLIGAFAAYRHVTASLGHPAGSEMIDGLAEEVMGIATGRTTLLSVTLLRHALAGEVADPVAELMRAVTGRGSVSTAVERCVALGGSSGRALAHGIVCGARAGCEVSA